MDQLDSKVIDGDDLKNKILPNIILSEDQERAATAVCDWYSGRSITEKQEFDDDPAINRFILAGLAGTGKSTIIPFVLQRLGLSASAVHFCAYTGKASLVLQSKGLPATTMHKLIYDPQVDSNGNVTFELKSRYDQVLKNLKLIVVDEASMVGLQMQEDLESFGIPVLYVGDHGQLPPVGDDMAKLMESPDVRLEKIHRQAEGNPIIRAAMTARKNGSLPHGTFGDNVVKIRNSQIPRNKLLEADQVLCGKNLTRRKLNDEIRSMLHPEFIVGQPDVGDKVICLRNDWNIGIVNGMVGELTKVGKLRAHNSRGYEHPHFSGCDFRDETDYTFRNLNLDQKVFSVGKSDKWDRQIQQFDFGYAITVHKSQGSQYRNLIVFEEWLGDKSFHRLWLYTAVTRAMENLIIVQG